MAIPVLVQLKEWKVTKRYLHLPVKTGNEKIVLRIYQGGLLVREFDIELAQNEQPDWWAFYDMTPFHGTILELVDANKVLSEDAIAWLGDSITEGDDLREAGDLYHETHRPQFHFTTRRGWTNDPNGMVYADGVWHLYYQYNPFGTTWGNMHWGHAVSPDLVHWTEKPIALYQRSLQDMAFSGGGFVDWQNTSGTQSADRPPLLVAFTSTGRGECLAASTDGGMTFTEFDENPVIRHQGRDPKILWFEPEQKWVMIVYEETGEEIGYAIYDSRDLKRWNRLSLIPGYFECPELFELPVEGRPDLKYWVVYGCLGGKSRSSCAIGTFDGSCFTPLQENRVSHYGPQFYASQIFSDAPDNRRIMMGWLAGAQYSGMPFSEGMSVPLELSLRETGQGLRLCFYPVKEIESLHSGTMSIQETTAEHANILLYQVSHSSELLDIRLVLYTSEDHTFSLDVRGHSIHYHATTGELSFAGSVAWLDPGHNELELRVLLDRSVTEVFANRGEAAFSAMTIADASAPIRLEGNVWIKEMVVHRLSSIW
jgi:fructan beta-fructosidase